jgi:DNA-binding CsgD family transcriptional regulator
MKRKIAVRMPHRSGRCRSCHGQRLRRLESLCLKCLRFVNQDIRGQRCFLMSQSDLARINENAYPKVTSPLDGGKREEVRTSQFQERVTRLLKKASLSQRQRQIVRLLVFERRTYLGISKKLGISKGCVREQALRAWKKLIICITPALLSEGQNVSDWQTWKTPKRFPLDRDSKVTHLTTSERFFENEFECNSNLKWAKKNSLSLRRNCPRCDDHAFSVGREFQYCMSCGWISDQERPIKPNQNRGRYVHVSQARAYL